MAHEYNLMVFVRTYTDNIRDIKAAVTSALVKSSEIHSVIDVEVEEARD